MISYSMMVIRSHMHISLHSLIIFSLLVENQYSPLELEFFGIECINIHFVDVIFRDNEEKIQ